MLVPEELLPGDVILYSPTDWIGWLIALKTWVALSHIEVYLGRGKVVAARPQGVDVYDPRIDDSLRYVRRPVIGAGVQFNADAALESIKYMLGKPYQVSGLFKFYAPWHHRHKATRICSSVATVFLRGGGCQPFNPAVHADDTTPSMFFQTPDLLTIFDSKQD